MSAVLELPDAPAVAAAAPDAEFLGFRIGAHRLLASYLDAVELEAVPPLARAPAAPAWIAGLANLHGGVIAVLDLRPLLGEAPRTMVPGAHAVQMMLVLRHHKDRIALLIDGMTSRLRFAAHERMGGEAGEAFYAPFVARTYRQGGEAWHELDYAGFFDGLNAFNT